MKTFKFLIVLLFSSLASFAQTEPKVVAVVTKANWCPACVKNGGRVGAEVVPKVNLDKIVLVVNDLTDKKTTEASKEELKKYGFDTLKLKSTGVISFIDVNSKKVLSTISVSKSSEDLLTEFNKYTH